MSLKSCCWSCDRAPSMTWRGLLSVIRSFSTPSCLCLSVTLDLRATTFFVAGMVYAISTLSSETKENIWVRMSLVKCRKSAWKQGTHRIWASALVPAKKPAFIYVACHNVVAWRDAPNSLNTRICPAWAVNLKKVCFRSKLLFISETLLLSLISCQLVPSFGLEMLRPYKARPNPIFPAPSFWNTGKIGLIPWITLLVQKGLFVISVPHQLLLLLGHALTGNTPHF